jgi:hypothetical protein
MEALLSSPRLAVALLVCLLRFSRYALCVE